MKAFTTSAIPASIPTSLLLEPALPKSSKVTLLIGGEGTESPVMKSTFGSILNTLLKSKLFGPINALTRSAAGAGSCWRVGSSSDS